MNERDLPHTGRDRVVASAGEGLDDAGPGLMARIPRGRKRPAGTKTQRPPEPPSSGWGARGRSAVRDCL